LQINATTVALVTGGASGLGEATTGRLHEGGAAVVIIDLPSSPGQALAAELGARVRFCATDVRDEAQVQAAIAAAQELGDLRIVVNCAGGGHAGPARRQERPHGPQRLPKRH
jgi:NAD(P)-dependent dehydrogenase (short-subunit alcohol dehydrogenase family)